MAECFGCNFSQSIPINQMNEIVIIVLEFNQVIKKKITVIEIVKKFFKTLVTK